MLNLILTCIASSFLQTALTTALPSMIQDLHISVSEGQWLTSGYSLAMGIMMPLTAFLITRCPTKKLYVSAIGIFLMGLIVCIFATNFPVMMIGRVLQACSNGITSSMAQVVLLTIYPPEKRGTVMGWYGLSVGAAPVIAPTIAGILVDTLGWRTIFVIAFVVLMLSFIMALTSFDDVLDTYVKKFDSCSFVLSALVFGGITLGIGNLSALGISAVRTSLPLVIGVIAGVLFTRRQLCLEEPFLNLRILKVPEYRLSVIGSMMLYLVMMGSSVIMPFVTFGISSMGAENTAHGTALLTLLRTIAGAIGTAVFVGILNVCEAGKAVASYPNPGIYGLHVTFACMTVATVIMLAIISIGMRKRSRV